MTVEQSFTRGLTRPTTLYHYHRDAHFTVGAYRAKVRRIRGGTQSLGAAEARVQRRIAALLSGGLPLQVRADQIRPVFPESVEYDVFPLMFYCITCSKTWPFNEQRDLLQRLQREPYLFRHQCGRPQVIQAGQVLCCKCGNIQPPRPPQHCNMPANLERIDLNDPSSWRWRCANVRCTHRDQGKYMQTLCPSCRDPMVLKPAEASGVTVPMAAKFVELTSEDLSALAPHFDLDLGMPTFEDFSRSMGSIFSETRKRDLYRQAQGDKAVEELGRTFALPAPTMEALREEAQSFLALRELSSGPSKQAPTLPAGFLNAWHLDGINIIDAVYGYKVTYDEHATLQAFSTAEGFEAYVHKNLCEGIMFQLDPLAVHAQLLAAGTPLPASPRQFFANLAHADPNNAVAQGVRTLTHTLSHALLKQAPVFCGIDTTNLSEMTLPGVPAFVIYNVSASALGGMKTLFDNAFTEWLNAAKTSITTCNHDPLCASQPTGAFCSACLLLPEISCGHFNANLDRIVANQYWS